MEKKYEDVIITDIKKLIFLLKGSKSYSTNYELISILDGLYELCDNLGISYPHYSDFTSKTISYVKETTNLDEVKYLKRLFNNINNLKYDLNVDFEIFKKRNNEIEQQLISEFLKNNNMDAYLIYNNLKSQNRIIYIERMEEYDDIDGFTISSPFNHIIISFCDVSLEKESSTIHEIFHVYDKIKYNHDSQFNLKRTSTNDFTEVMPIFYELLYSDYLCDKKIIHSNLYLKMLLNSIYIEVEDNLSALNNNFYDSIIAHYFGSILALEFYDQYIENKEKALNNLDAFEKNYAYQSYDEIINSYGLNKNKILNLSTIKKYSK